MPPGVSVTDSRYTELGSQRTSDARENCARWRVHALPAVPAAGSLRASEPVLSPNEGGPMRVNPEDGRCRSCGGTLTIIDADDATLTVECQCGEVYDVETDAFGDGCMVYWPTAMEAKMRGGDE